MLSPVIPGSRYARPGMTTSFSRRSNPKIQAGFVFRLDGRSGSDPSLREPF